MIALLDRVELAVVTLASKLAPWLASALAMLLVVQTGLDYLHWPAYTAVVAGAAIEFSGVLAIHTFLRLRDYNAGRHADDAEAPMAAAWFSLIIYFGSLLAVVTASLVAELRQYLMLVSPFLSLADMVALGLSSSQTRREQVAAERAAERAAEQERVRAERRERRQAERLYRLEHEAAQAAVQVERVPVQTEQAPDNRRAVLDWFSVNPHGSPSAAAQDLGLSRTTVYTWLRQLEQAGEIKRNGQVTLLAEV